MSLLGNVLSREFRVLNVTAKQISRSKLQNTSYVLTKYFLILFSSDVALSSLPDTLFTSRSTMFGGAYIPREVLEQQALSKRPTGK